MLIILYYLENNYLDDTKYSYSYKNYIKLIYITNLLSHF